MRRFLILVAVHVGALAGGAALAKAQSPAPYRPASLAAALREWESDLGHGPGLPSPALPPAWEVQTPDRRYSISTQPLRTLLQTVPQDPAGRKSRIREAQAWLDMLARQLEGFETGPAPSAAARARLDLILARKEFAGANRSPSPWDLWRERMAAWLQELLRRIFGVVAQHPTASQILIWVVMAGCVGFLAVWLIRWWGSDRRIPRLPQPTPAEAVRTEEEWLAAAHRAAAEGDWRQAIHNVYWAAISRLQRSGALPQDLTNTPREFLRLLSTGPAPKSHAPASREPLAVLTSGLERFWYARRSARPEDFRESLGQLERLACKVA